MKHYDLDVVMISAGMQMSGETIPSGKSLGGSETCAIQLAEALARRGHHVTLFCNTEREHAANKVYYVPIGWVQNRMNGAMFPKGFFDFARSVPTDLLIAQRVPNFLGFEFKTKVNLLWQHDLATRTGPSSFHAVLWNIDKIITPSDFMRRQYQKVHGGPDRLYQVIRNGIDLELIDSTATHETPAGAPIERDRFRLTYTSRPERGLDILLRDVFPQILAKEPRARLFLSRYEDPTTLPLYQQLEGEIKRFGDRVVNLGNLGKRDLYHNYRKSRLLLYPSQFEEIFFITGQEAGACGLPVVASNKAALSETLGYAHVLIKEDGSVAQQGEPTENGFGQHRPEFIKAFVEQAVNLMHDDEQWEKLSALGRKRAEEMTWDGVVDQWVDLAHEKIAARSNEPRRMIKHFIMNSDVVAARKYAAKIGTKALIESVDHYIKTYVPFMDVQDSAERRAAINNFYEQRSGGARADYRTAFWADKEPRLQMLLAFMRDKVERGELPQDAAVLDFGCAHGGYVRVLSNEFPRMKFVGVDNSLSLIRCANELLKAKMPDGQPAFRFPQNAGFMVGDENLVVYGHDNQAEASECYHHYLAYAQRDDQDNLTPQNCDHERRFDLVVCMEVLEHLPHAEEVVGKLEQLCKPDGLMVFTVPYGHRERDELVTKGIPPVHVRSFDLHDMRDLFGKKKDYGVISFSDYAETVFDRTMSSWFMATYRNDRAGAGEIDWERKFFLQGPRETLSVCMIVNNSEAVLHRCLRSIQKLADQIIIIDNGPSADRTVEVSREYTADVRAGTNPFWCYAHAVIHSPDQIVPGQCEMAGFETPRNESIEGAWGDQICFVPGTQIRTRNGYRAIENIEVGEEVLTHKGRFRKVKQLHKNDYDGEIVRLKPSYLAESIGMTPNHPVLSVKNFECYIHGKFCFPECRRQWRYYQPKTRRIETAPFDESYAVANCRQGYQHYEMAWREASDINKRDTVVSQGQLPEAIETTRIDIVAYIDSVDMLIDENYVRPDNGKGIRVPRWIDPDGDFWRLCGYYLSEGHCSEINWTVGFSFHAGEVGYHEDVIGLMGRFFGLIEREIFRPDSNSMQIIFNSKVAAMFFANFLGRGADNKRLPECAMNLPGEMAFQIFQGVWRGDGTLHPDSFKITSNSRLMLIQLRDILMRFGIASGIGRHDRARNHAFVLTIGGAGLDILNRLYGMMHPFRADRSNEKGWKQDGWTDGEKLYLAVRDVWREQYRGPVYNLGVEEDNSYQAEDIIVHNCWIDADEQILEGHNVWKYLRPNVYNGYALQQHHISIDPPQAIKRDIPVRLFRNGMGMRCIGLVHEHFELGPNRGVGPECTMIQDFHIHHDGYLTESIRRGRFGRNLKLLQCDRLKYPDRLLGIYLYEVRDSIHLARYEMERNGGVVTPEVERHCRTVIAAFQKHFLAKDVLLAEDGMDYYSNALAMLGLGVEVMFDVDVKKQGAVLNGGAKRFRVMNAEEAKLVAAKRIEQLTAPLEGPYVA